MMVVHHQCYYFCPLLNFSLEQKHYDSAEVQKPQTTSCLSVRSLVISQEQWTFFISREQAYAPCFKLVIGAKYVIYFKQAKILTYCLWPLKATYKNGNCWIEN